MFAGFGSAIFPRGVEDGSRGTKTAIWMFLQIRIAVRRGRCGSMVSSACAFD